MSDTQINRVQQQIYQEQVQRQEREQRAREKRQYDQEVQKLAQHRQSTIDRIRNNFASEKDALELQQSQSLADLRQRHAKAMVAEQERLEQELADLRGSYKAKLDETRLAQETNLQKINQDNQAQIKNAYNRYQRELKKLS